jgi:hypothetical protein
VLNFNDFQHVGELLGTIQCFFKLNQLTELKAMHTFSGSKKSQCDIFFEPNHTMPFQCDIFFEPNRPIMAKCDFFFEPEEVPKVFSIMFVTLIKIMTTLLRLIVEALSIILILSIDHNFTVLSSLFAAICSNGIFSNFIKCQ